LASDENGNDRPIMCMLAECGAWSINKPVRVGSTEAT
jgi:hypothetical protein